MTDIDPLEFLQQIITDWPGIETEDFNPAITAAKMINSPKENNTIDDLMKENTRIGKIVENIVGEKYKSLNASVNELSEFIRAINSAYKNSQSMNKLLAQLENDTQIEKSTTPQDDHSISQTSEPPLIPLSITDVYHHVCEEVLKVESTSIPKKHFQILIRMFFLSLKDQNIHPIDGYQLNEIYLILSKYLSNPNAPKSYKTMVETINTGFSLKSKTLFTFEFKETKNTYTAINDPYRTNKNANCIRSTLLPDPFFSVIAYKEVISFFGKSQNICTVLVDNVLYNEFIPQFKENIRLRVESLFQQRNIFDIISTPVTETKSSFFNTKIVSVVSEIKEILTYAEEMAVVLYEFTIDIFKIISNKCSDCLRNTLKENITESILSIPNEDIVKHFENQSKLDIGTKPLENSDEILYLCSLHKSLLLTCSGISSELFNFPCKESNTIYAPIRRFVDELKELSDKSIHAISASLVYVAFHYLEIPFYDPSSSADAIIKFQAIVSGFYTLCSHLLSADEMSPVFSPLPDILRIIIEKNSDLLNRATLGEATEITNHLNSVKCFLFNFKVL